MTSNHKPPRGHGPTIMGNLHIGSSAVSTKGPPEEVEAGCPRVYCDEENDTVIEDLVECECADAQDPKCPELVKSQPCFTSTRCNVNSHICVVDQLQEGAECDDGIPCTQGTTCNAEGHCGGGTRNEDDCED